MPREKGPPKIYPEVGLPVNHPATRRLQREASARGVTLNQHIYDLLMDREAFLQGQEGGTDELRATWVPRGSAAPPATGGTAPSAPDEDEGEVPPAAKKAAAAWLKRGPRGGG